jgi:arginine/lysine/ornithine decarboxylase
VSRADYPPGAGDRPLRVVPTPRAASLIPGQGAPDLHPSGPPAPAPGAHPHHLDQRRAPLVEAIERYRRRSTVSFHCPAHRGGRAADQVLRGLVGHEMLAADVWFEPGELHRVRRAAEDLAASLWGADRAFFLGNGSSSGNQALLLGTLRPGDEVVVARDAHISTLTALVLTGARPVWVTPDVHPDAGVPLGVRPEALAATLAAHPQARLVVVVSPSYAGACSDLRALADVAHAAGVPLAVDEAWGAHLPFHPWLPTDALGAGADAVVTSTHKLAGSLSQSALLLVRGERLDVDSVAAAVRMTATTSPLLPLLASIDSCRRRLALEGHALLDRALVRAGLLRERLAGIAGVSVVDGERLGVAPSALDPLKVVLDVTGLGRTGVEVDRLLRDRYDVAVEGADLQHVYLVVSAGDRDTGLDALARGLDGLRLRGAPAVSPPVSPGAVLAPRPRAVSPRLAWFARSETVPLFAAVGRVAAELATPYPPGVPVLVPGEVIDAEQVDYLEAVLAAGGHVHGTADPTLTTLRVLAADG